MNKFDELFSDDILFELKLVDYICISILKLLLHTLYFLFLLTDINAFISEDLIPNELHVLKLPQNMTF